MCCQVQVEAEPQGGATRMGDKSIDSIATIRLQYTMTSKRY